MASLTPVIVEELPVEREGDNQHNKHAFAVMNNEDIVSQTSHFISRVSCFFLKHGREKTCCITGSAYY